MREESTNTAESIDNIYRRATAPFAANPVIASSIPAFRSVRSGLYRHRGRVIPRLPETKAEIDIPEHLRTTVNGEPFLLEAIGENDILIFCSSTNLRELCMADVIAMDGTFDAVPTLYLQLFTLHIFVAEKQLPVAYCLMLSKTRDAYASVFNTLKTKAHQAGLTLNPTTFLSDFETGLIAAVRDEFPNATHRGCYFRLTQAVWRQVQSLGLANTYAQDDTVRLQVRQLMALGFAPRLLIRTIFQQLRSSAAHVLEPLFEYFEKQWMVNIPIQMWIVYQINLRTNNHCEGWHNRFNRLVNKHHPNILRLLTAIREEQASSTVTRLQITAGQEVVRSNKKYLDIEKRIQRLSKMYNDGSIDAIEMITGISHNLSYYN